MGNKLFHNQLMQISLNDRISRGVLDKISKHSEKKKIHEDGETRKDRRTALIILVGFPFFTMKKLNFVIFNVFPFLLLDSNIKIL